MKISFPLLEKAIRSQFVLLHRYEDETEWEWQQRRSNAHPLYCDGVEKVKTLALIVFLGLLDEYRLDEDDAADYLQVDIRFLNKCINKYEACMEKAIRAQKQGKRLQTDSIEAKVLFKAGLVRRWLKANAV